jgi:hypothetical protein
MHAAPCLQGEQIPMDELTTIRLHGQAGGRPKAGTGIGKVSGTVASPRISPSPSTLPDTSPPCQFRRPTAQSHPPSGTPPKPWCRPGRAVLDGPGRRRSRRGSSSRSPGARRWNSPAPLGEPGAAGPGEGPLLGRLERGERTARPLGEPGAAGPGGGLLRGRLERDGGTARLPGANPETPLVRRPA